MNIGYACKTLGVPDTNFNSCIIKNADEKRLLELISYNLNSLENIIDYNISNEIKLFRISSDLIPFGSHPVNKIPWWNVFSQEFFNIGEKIKSSGMRVSMHPGQYTVLNSPNEEVVKRAIDDLNYHQKILERLGVGSNSKIILHIGGIYNNKKQAIKRFIDNYKKLDEKVKLRLVIENDDKLYNINDVLEIGSILNIPVIFDNLHHKVNSGDEKKSEKYWTEVCSKTWKEEDGFQKIHYSQQNPQKKQGAHSESIYINKFLNFYKKIENKKIDIMLEVKDKNLSAIKCINSISKKKTIKDLELEWSKYKYIILEKDPSAYLEIRNLLKNKSDYPVLSFYNFIENFIQKKEIKDNSINAALHVWGYFKKIALDSEKNKFFRVIERYKQGKTSLLTIKNFLWKLAVKYNETYLLNSYYFIDQFNQKKLS